MTSVTTYATGCSEEVPGTINGSGCFAGMDSFELSPRALMSRHKSIFSCHLSHFDTPPVISKLLPDKVFTDASELFF